MATIFRPQCLNQVRCSPLAGRVRQNIHRSGVGVTTRRTPPKATRRAVGDEMVAEDLTGTKDRE